MSLILIALATSASISTAGTELPVTLLDLPHNVQGPGTSMQQSLELSYSVQRLGLMGTQALATWALPERPLLRTGLGLTAASLLPQLGVSTWMHEEWHRTPMSRHGVSNMNSYTHIFGPLYTAGSWMTPTLITAEVDNISYLIYCGPPSKYSPYSG